MTETELERLAIERGGSVGKSVAEQVREAVDRHERSQLRPKGCVQRHETGKMNQLESAYAVHLTDKQRSGEVHAFFFECMKLRLADKTWYCPDFLVLDKNGELSFHETKGFRRDDAMVKLKVAASQYPLFPFWLVSKMKGGWDLRRMPS